VAPVDGRILGIDLGEVRIGLALSDPAGIFAQPIEPLVRRGERKDLDALARLVGEHEVTGAVVGLPLLLSGARGPKAVAAREFAERLARRLATVPVELWDERLTTVEAERTMIAADVDRRRRRQSLDSVAAALILSSFLDARAAARSEPHP
jgi:putative Holliday junction resolvase